MRYYYHKLTDTRESAEQQFAYITNLKEMQIRDWRENRLRDADIIYNNSVFTGLINNYLASGNDPALEERIVALFTKTLHNINYDSVFLLNPQGKLLLQYPQDENFFCNSVAEALSDIKESNQTLFIDLHRDTNQLQTKTHITLVIPIYDDYYNPQKLTGIVGVRVNPYTVLYPLIQYWPAYSPTNETVIVRREGDSAVILSDYRLKDKKSLINYSLKNKNVPAVKAVLGKRGQVEGVDNGVPVLAYIRPVGDSNWLLVSTINKSELLAPMKKEILVNFGLLLFVMLNAIPLMGMFWYRKTSQIYREKMEAEKELAWLHNVIARSSFEVFVVNPDNGRIIFANEGAAKNIGYSVEELKNMSSLDLNPGYDKEGLERLKEFIKHDTGQQIVVFETVKTRKDGSTYPAEVDLQVVGQGNDRVLLALVNDISERKNREKELKAKNEELEAFTYTVSHDLKSPLVTIKAFIGFLKQDLLNQDTERIERDMYFIETAAKKMSHLLDELLKLSRIGRVAGNPEELAYNAVIQEVIYSLLGRIGDKKIELMVDEHDLTLIGDRQRLTEIWQNLIDNAIKFSDKDQPVIEIGVIRDAGDPVFYVRDNGIGIDPKYHNKIFGLFEKLDSDSEGTGVGLALVKKIVETYQGRIWLESEELGKGTTFYFTLPAAIKR